MSEYLIASTSLNFGLGKKSERDHFSLQDRDVKIPDEKKLFYERNPYFFMLHYIFYLFITANFQLS